MSHDITQQLPLFAAEAPQGVPVPRRRRAWPWRLLLAAAVCVSATQFTGCSAFRNFDGIPASYLPTELKATSREGMRTINPNRLTRRQTKDYRIEAGDVLAIYVPGVLGRWDHNATEAVGDAPPINLSINADDPPTVGFPITVRDDHTVSLPQIEPLNVRGMTVQEVERAVRQAYTGQSQILKDGRGVESARILVSLQRPREYRVIVVRQDTLSEAGSSAQAGQLNLGASRRGVAREVRLRAHENDVLHALARVQGADGLPGLDGENAIYIIKARGRHCGSSQSDESEPQSSPLRSGHSDQSSTIIRGASEPLGYRDGHSFQQRTDESQYDSQVRPAYHQESGHSLGVVRADYTTSPESGRQSDQLQLASGEHVSQEYAPHGVYANNGGYAPEGVYTANAVYPSQSVYPTNGSLAIVTPPQVYSRNGQFAPGPYGNHSAPAGQPQAGPWGNPSRPAAPEANRGAPGRMLMPRYAGDPGPAETGSWPGAPTNLLPNTGGAPPVQNFGGGSPTSPQPTPSPWDEQPNPAADSDSGGTHVAPRSPWETVPSANSPDQGSAHPGNPQRDSDQSRPAGRPLPWQQPESSSNDGMTQGTTGRAPIAPTPEVGTWPGTPRTTGAPNINAPSQPLVPIPNAPAPGSPWGQPPAGFNGGYPSPQQGQQYQGQGQPQSDQQWPAAPASPNQYNGDNGPMLPHSGQMSPEPTLNGADDQDSLGPLPVDANFEPRPDWEEELDSFNPTIDSEDVIRIPVRLYPGEELHVSEEDITLENGDIVFIESRDTEVFYTGGLMGGGQYTLPRDYDLTVTEAISLAQGQSSGGGSSTSQGLSSSGGVSALNQDVVTGASRVIVRRRTQDGRRFNIEVDINKALRYPQEDILIQPGDFLLLRYSKLEAVSAFFQRNLLEGALLGIAAGQLQSSGSK